MNSKNFVSKTFMFNRNSHQISPKYLIHNFYLKKVELTKFFA
jgi:hypothetical protein